VKCEKNLKKLKINLRKDWGKNLKNKNVKFPAEGTQRLYGILCLYENIKKPLTVKEMLQWFELNNLPKYDRQIRHIADDGWYIVGGNKRSTRFEVNTKFSRAQICLQSVKKPNPIWSEKNLKRQNFLKASTWNQILETFKNRGCAVCGLKFKNYDKGHLLLDKPYTKNNIVPMCSSCNNWGQMYNLEFKMDKDLRARPILKK